ncbi:MAG: gliding motility-associated C-terminal domain-containing protein, partial [Bacteroidales bacterium]
EVPNIFTPNGDGQNDFFQVEAKTLETFQGKVVNRWGNTIYEWENYEDEEAGWDGKLPGGSDASSGVYFYIITGTGIDGYEYELTGPFHLTR